jgi:hypothetical protein
MLTGLSFRERFCLESRMCHCSVLLQICHLQPERGGPYPGLYLFTEQARMVRPVRQVRSGKHEMIGTLEQCTMHIRSTPTRSFSAVRGRTITSNMTGAVQYSDRFDTIWSE